MTGIIPGHKQGLCRTSRTCQYTVANPPFIGRISIYFIGAVDRSPSLLFGFLHANNLNATLTSSLNLALMGLFLGLGFILTGELAIPIGLHIAWNFTQGYVFGFPVSGSNEGLSLLATHQSGPTIWTGGAFGPEGGLIVVLAALLGMLLVYGWVRWTRRRVSVQTGLAQYSPLHPKAV